MFSKSKLVFAALSLAVVSSSYASCIKDLCLNDIAIDPNNSVGIVVGLDVEKGIISFKREGYSYNSNYTYSQLSKKIESSEFTFGKYIIDENNNVGKVRYVFKDNRMQYKKNGYSYYHVSRKLKPEVDELNNIKAGIKVIDSNNNTGKAIHVFSDGRVEYRKNGYSYNHISSSLKNEVLVDKSSGIKAGMTVINNDNNVGTAKTVFADGRIEYRKNGYSYNHISSKLVKRVESLGELERDILVINSDNTIGRVVNVFEDGRVEYRKNGYSYNHIGRNLSHRVEESEVGLREGMYAIDSDNSVGVIKNIFSNGKIEFRKNGYSYSHIRSKLSKEIDSHTKYLKGEDYATNNNQIGTVLRFFENGKVQLSRNGYSLISSKLYPEVSSVLGIEVGGQLVLPGEEEVKAIRLFENNTVEFEVKDANDESQLMKLSSKILDINTMTNTDYTTWAGALYIHLQYENNAFSITQNKAVIAKADYETLRATLLDKLENEEIYPNNDDIRNKLIKHLTKDREDQVDNTTLDTNEDNRDIIVDSNAQSGVKIYQVIVNKKKIVSDVLAVLNKYNLNYTVISESEVQSTSPVIRFDYKNGILKKSCHVSIEENNSIKTAVYKSNLKNVLDVCLDKLEGLL